MPAFHPAARPSFGRSTSRAAGKRSRTSSSVPSVEPWSTTTVSCRRTLSRHRSTQGSASSVTTTAVTGSAIRDGTARDGAAEPLPREDQRARDGHEDRHEEEEEPGRERAVGVDAHRAEEAHEERLADREAVDRERDEQHEEEHRPHDVVDPRRELDARRPAREPDREHAHGLDG